MSPGEDALSGAVAGAPSGDAPQRRPQLLFPCAASLGKAKGCSGEGDDVDPDLARFLNWIRPRARRAHAAFFEAMVVELGDHLRRRGRRARTLGAADLRGFLASWALRNEPHMGGAELRAFGAALCVFAAWHAAGLPAGRGRRLRADVRRGVRDTRRAFHAGALLDACITAGPLDRTRDGFWQVALAGATHVVLRDIQGGACVGPIPLPAGVVAALPAGAVLNLRLASGATGWSVVEHGACYPALVASELRAGVWS
jgi:hypothetical protein